MTKISIVNLIIEVTRKCNLKCLHCYNGMPQDVDIDKDTVDKFLSNVDKVYSLLITGGEPTLHLDSLIFILDTLKKYNIPLHQVNITSNGIRCNDEFIDICNEYYNYVIDKQNSALLISVDNFHYCGDKPYRPALIRRSLNRVKKELINYGVWGNCNLPVKEQFLCDIRIDQNGNGELNAGIIMDAGILVINCFTRFLYTPVYDRTIAIICLTSNGGICSHSDLPYEYEDNIEYRITTVKDINNADDILYSTIKWNLKKKTSTVGKLYYYYSKYISLDSNFCTAYHDIKHNIGILLNEILRDYDPKEYELRERRLIEEVKKSVGIKEGGYIPEHCRWYEF